MKIRSILLYLFFVILSAFVFYEFLFNKYFAVYRVDQSSMENALFDGDRVFVKKMQSYERNDIIVFKHYDVVYIKRCLAIAGDYVEILGGKIYINGKIETSNAATKESKKNTDPGKNIMVMDFFGKNWTLNDWGPVTIPKKGNTIDLTPENITIYKKVIIHENDNRFIEEELTTLRQYTFKNNYLFVVGDNRSHSDDSRIFGFIPVNNLIGTTNTVLYSTSRGSRFFKRIL